MTLIFDFDGTLHKTDEVYGVAVRKVLKELFERGKIDEDTYREKGFGSNKFFSKYLGVSPVNMWKDYLPSIGNSDLVKEIVPAVGAEMNVMINKGEALLFPHVEETLDILKEKGYTMYILSNCTNNYMENQKIAFGLDRWFERYYVGENYPGMTKAEIFESFREPEKEYMMIGDRKGDLDVGTIHGIPTVACRFGYGNEEEYKDSTYIIDNFSQLLTIL